MTVSLPSPVESRAHSRPHSRPHSRAPRAPHSPGEPRALRMVPFSPQVSWHSRPVPSGTFWHRLQKPALLRASATGSGAISSRSIKVEGKHRVTRPPASGSFPSTWKPCCPPRVQWFCHTSFPTPYLTVLGFPVAKLSRLSVEPGGVLFSPKNSKM